MNAECRESNVGCLWTLILRTSEGGAWLVRVEDDPPRGRGIIVRNAEARIPAKHIYYEIRNSATESQDSQSFWAIPKGARISS